MLLLVRLILLLSFLVLPDTGFRQKQMRHERVREAYKQKDARVRELLAGNGLRMAEINICLLAFKREKQLELWGKNASDTQYRLIQSYRICYLSGRLGPKRNEGDRQVPEGFYHINFFNPESIYHLSLGINYPNPSDQILAHSGRPGGSIFIHGDCVSIGCLPITNDRIKELYIFAVEATNNGQGKIPVIIFPSRLTDDNLSMLEKNFQSEGDIVELWRDLKKYYDFFIRNRRLPAVEFLPNGRHLVQ